MDVRMYDDDYVRLTALRRDAMPFSPTLRIGLNYYALSGLFQQSAEQTNQQFKNSPPLRGLRGLKARIISAPSRKGGVSMSAPYLEG